MVQNRIKKYDDKAKGRIYEHVHGAWAIIKFSKLSWVPNPSKIDDKSVPKVESFSNQFLYRFFIDLEWILESVWMQNGAQKGFKREYKLITMQLQMQVWF